MENANCNSILSYDTLRQSVEMIKGSKLFCSVRNTQDFIGFERGKRRGKGMVLPVQCSDCPYDINFQ